MATPAEQFLAELTELSKKYGLYIQSDRGYDGDASLEIVPPDPHERFDRYHGGPGDFSALCVSVTAELDSGIDRAAIELRELDSEALKLARGGDFAALQDHWHNKHRELTTKIAKLQAERDAAREAAK